MSPIAITVLMRVLQVVSSPISVRLAFYDSEPAVDPARRPPTLKTRGRCGAWPIPRRALKLITPLQYSSERPLIVNAKIVFIGAGAEVHGSLSRPTNHALTIRYLK
jgi:hypothetical protein